MPTINPILLLIVIGCGCYLFVLRESPKAAKTFFHWLSQHHAGTETYRRARAEYRVEHRLDEREMA